MTTIDNLPSLPPSALKKYNLPVKSAGLNLAKTITLDPSEYRVISDTAKAPLLLENKPLVSTPGNAIVERYADGYAKNHPGSTSFAGSSTNTQSAGAGFAENSAAAKPSFFSKYKPEWLKMPEFMKGTVGDTAVYQKASGLAGKGIEKVAEGAAEGSFRAGVASKATSFLGQMANVSKTIPVVGVAISTLFEAPAIIQGFKEGRGAAQIMKSGSAVTGTTIGSVVGATVGTMIPLPGMTFVGGAVGAMVGNWAGSKLGSGLWGSNKGDTQVAQAQPAVVQQPAQFGTMTAANGVIAPMPFDFNNPTADLLPLV